MSVAVGQRVIAIRDGKDRTIYYFGEGVYAGDFVPPEGIGGFNIGLPNPRLDLDNGQTVWGCECWWGPVEKLRNRWPEPAWTWVLVDIDAARCGEADA